MNKLEAFWIRAKARAVCSKEEICHWSAGVAFGTKDTTLHDAAINLAVFSASAQTLEAIQTYIEEKMAGVR